MSNQVDCKSVKLTWVSKEGKDQSEFLRIVRRTIRKPRPGHTCVISGDEILGSHTAYIFYWLGTGLQDPLIIFRSCELDLSHLEARMAKFLQLLPDSITATAPLNLVSEYLRRAELPEIL